MEFLGSSATLALGATSVAVGAAMTRFWCEDRENALHLERFAQVRHHSRLVCAPHIELDAAVWELLAALSICFSIEAQPESGVSALGCFAPPEDKEGQTGADAAAGHRPSRGELQRRLHHLRRMCELPEKRRKRLSEFLWGSDASKSQHTSAKHLIGNIFDPGNGSVNDERGICAAVCYLVVAVIKLTCRARGHFQHARRA
eukprot:CAMPEP_0179286698 /NCGR_PEP_ID=MMETSP0797-20121207/39880_1 /TAXON_ID=47934 /ORGANISM="Dinophysis acuminata, Strain DAEP01" /LENGTH=200 /DNA_ID=CAMNT_0020995599 /DNA_START=34 /DNA_END=633 /DNA_ORIENTATION=+